MASRFKGRSVEQLDPDLRSGKEAAVRQLLGKAPSVKPCRPYVVTPRHDSNVVGVGIGRRYTAGKGTPDHAVRVYVRHKLPKAKTGTHRIPTHFDGVPTDVIETGTFRALGAGIHAARSRTRPLRGGLSVGFASDEDFVVGTVGAIVQRGNDRFILSNNHVLAYENMLPLGTAIVQPSTIDNGKDPTDHIGQLAEFVPLQPRGNRMDAALARIDPRIKTSGGSVYGPRLASAMPTPALTGMRIAKCGRTTGLTRGRVDDVSLSVAVEFASGQFLFEDQLMLRADDVPFSGDGDSGALVVADALGRPVALLFAGAPAHAIATPIERVLSQFGVTILV